MFIKWVYVKFKRWWKRWGSVAKWFFILPYIGWCFASIIIFIIDRIPISQDLFPEVARAIRYTLLPISTITVLFPLLTYVIYRIGLYLYNQYIDYSYFAESGGKLKNEEKLKNDEYESYDERKKYDKEDEPETKPDNIDEIASRTYRRAFKQGIKNYIKAQEEEQKRQIEILQCIDTPPNIDSYEPGDIDEAMKDIPPYIDIGQKANNLKNTTIMVGDGSIYQRADNVNISMEIENTPVDIDQPKSEPSITVSPYIDADVESNAGPQKKLRNDLAMDSDGEILEEESDSGQMTLDELLKTSKGKLDG